MNLSCCSRQVIKESAGTHGVHNCLFPRSLVLLGGLKVYLSWGNDAPSDICFYLVRNLFASFFDQPRRYSVTAALHQDDQAIFHPPSNFMIGDKNQRIFSARNIAYGTLTALLGLVLFCQKNAYAGEDWFIQV